MPVGIQADPLFRRGGRSQATIDFAELCDRFRLDLRHFAKRQSLEAPDNRIKLAGLFGGKGQDYETPPRDRLYKAVAFQPQQRFTDGRAADAELRCQGMLTDRLVGR